MLPFEHKSQLRVRYGETDQMGVVWHGNYILYFEAARTEALRACGGSYRAMEEEGVLMPVVSLNVDFLKPARYEDLLTITVKVDKPPRSRMVFNYEIDNQDGELLVTGETVLAFVDATTRRPCRPPAYLREIFSYPPPV